MKKATFVIIATLLILVSFLIFTQVFSQPRIIPTVDHATLVDLPFTP